MADVDHKPEVISPAAVAKVADKVDRGAMGDIKPVAPKPSASKKKAAGTKPRKPAVSDEHPKYSVMIADAISQLKERGGSSRQAILKYVASHYRVGTEINKINARVKMSLKAGVKSGLLNQSKGTGASGSFRLGQRQKSSQKTARPRSSTAKATGSGKTAAKKSKTAVGKPKSPAKKTTPKKTKAKSLTKVKSPSKKTKAAPKKMKTAASKAKPKSAAAIAASKAKPKSAAAKNGIEQKKPVKKTGGKK